MQERSSWISHFIIPCSNNMSTEYCKGTSCPFHENDKQQQSSISAGQQQQQQHVFSKVISEQDLDTRLSRQRIGAWSSSSSMSSLSTGSLFSLSDSFSALGNYKTTGILFDNLDLVPFDPDIDPKPYACYNCWQFDHKCHSCPKVKILYCQNCGRRGVEMKECPRCARAYNDYLDSLDKQYSVFFSSLGMKDSMKETKVVEDAYLDGIVEGPDENWDDCKSHNESFPDYPQKTEMVHQYDDWDNYQTPRANVIEKTTKVYSLYATKAEVAKIKNEIWNEFKVDSYSYSWENHINVTDSASCIIPGEKAKYEFEDCGSFNQGTCTDHWVDEMKRYELENERAEHESECWSNHDAEVFKSSVGKEGSTATSTMAEKSTLEEQNNCWSNLTIEDVFTNPPITLTTSFKEDSSIDLEYKKVVYEEEDWNNIEACKSLQASFCEDLKNNTILYDTLDEEYWTDFDDDYQSLDGSFDEEYKSLNNTADGENDCTNMLKRDASEREEDSGFHESFQKSQNEESYQMFSFVKSTAMNDHYAALEISETNCYHSRSLENPNDACLSHDKDTDNYENMIVDEDERSEPISSAGHTVQEFLNLLDSLKNFPIETQNLAVLHYISRCKEQSWQRLVQSS